MVLAVAVVVGLGAVSELLPVFQVVVALQVIFQVDILLLDLLEALHEDKYISLPRPLDRLIGGKVGLLSASMLLAVLPGA